MKTQGDWTKHQIQRQNVIEAYARKLRLSSGLSQKEIIEKCDDLHKLSWAALLRRTNSFTVV